MNILEQIESILFCIVFGIIFSFLYTKIRKYMYFSKNRYNFLNSLLFMLNMTMIYFKCLYEINGGIILVHFLLITIIAFLFYTKYLQKKCQKKSNQL